MSTQSIPSIVPVRAEENDGRYVEVNYQVGTFNVILWDSHDASASAGEQEFADFNNHDMRAYIIGWLKYGKVIF